MHHGCASRVLVMVLTFPLPAGTVVKGPGGSVWFAAQYDDPTPYDDNDQQVLLSIKGFDMGNARSKIVADLLQKIWCCSMLTRRSLNLRRNQICLQSRQLTTDGHYSETTTPDRVCTQCFPTKSSLHFSGSTHESAQPEPPLLLLFVITKCFYASKNKANAGSASGHFCRVAHAA